MNNIETVKENVAAVEKTVKENVAVAEKMVKENVVVAEKMARKIWLAGIGAYGKGYEEAKGRLETLSTDSSKLFAE